MIAKLIPALTFKQIKSGYFPLAAHGRLVRDWSLGVTVIPQESGWKWGTLAPNERLLKADGFFFSRACVEALGVGIHVGIWPI